MQRSPDLIRLGALAAMIGGGLFVLLAVVTASMTRGCIAEECAYRTMRESPFGGGAVLALLLVGAGAVALLILARDAGRFGWLGWAGLAAAAVGIALVAIGVALNASDSPLVPAFVIPGGLALAAGFLLIGLAVLRARVLPWWAAALLVAGTLVMPAFNDQNWRAVLVIPFGAAWIAVGYVLWSRRSETVLARTGEAEESPQGAR